MKQTINIGSVANDGTGDPLRTAFTKINSNFTELYAPESLNATGSDTGLTVSTTKNRNQWTFTLSADAANTFVGSESRNFVQGTHSITAGGVLTAYRATATLQGTASQALIVGYDTHIGNQSSGAGGGGVITALIHFHAGTPDFGNSSTDLITNVYGLKIEDQSAVAVTNAYGVYQSGSTNINYFEGVTQLVGGVSGNTSFSGTITSTGGRVDITSAGLARLTMFNTSAGSSKQWIITHENSDSLVFTHFNGSGFDVPFKIDAADQKTTLGGPLGLVNLSSDPSSPTEGTIYYNNSTKHFYGWNGSAWKQMDN